MKTSQIFRGWPSLNQWTWPLQGVYSIFEQTPVTTLRVAILGAKKQEILECNNYQEDIKNQHSWGLDISSIQPKKRR
jgi:hypothetical protein